MKSNFGKRRRQGKDSFSKTFPALLTWCPSVIGSFESIPRFLHFLSLFLYPSFSKWTISLRIPNVDNNKLRCQLSNNLLTFLSGVATVCAVSNGSRVTVAMATRVLVCLPAFAFNLESRETWRLKRLTSLGKSQISLSETVTFDMVLKSSPDRTMYMICNQ